MHDTSCTIIVIKSRGHLWLSIVHQFHYCYCVYTLRADSEDRVRVTQKSTIIANDLFVGVCWNWWLSFSRLPFTCTWTNPVRQSKWESVHWAGCPERSLLCLFVKFVFNMIYDAVFQLIRWCVHYFLFRVHSISTDNPVVTVNHMRSNRRVPRRSVCVCLRCNHHSIEWYCWFHKRFPHEQRSFLVFIVPMDIRFFWYSGWMFDDDGLPNAFRRILCGRVTLNDLDLDDTIISLDSLLWLLKMGERTRWGFWSIVCGLYWWICKSIYSIAINLLVSVEWEKKQKLISKCHEMNTFQIQFQF